MNGNFELFHEAMIEMPSEMIDDDTQATVHGKYVIAINPKWAPHAYTREEGCWKKVKVVPDSGNDGDTGG